MKEERKEGRSSKDGWGEGPGEKGEEQAGAREERQGARRLAKMERRGARKEEGRARRSERGGARSKERGEGARRNEREAWSKKLYGSLRSPSRAVIGVILSYLAWDPPGLWGAVRRRISIS